jgi:uncharacterized FlgJ-related protein
MRAMAEKCPNIFKAADGCEGEMWYFTNRGSVEFYVAPVNGRAATTSFRITRRRLEKILEEIQACKR